MITIKDCNITLYNSGKIAYITLPKNPDIEIMKKLGRGKPCHGTMFLALEYKLNGLTCFLDR